MKTAMELALARIELMKDINPDSIHWEMFKQNYVEMEKQQIINAWMAKDNPLQKLAAEKYYNETYKSGENK
jgi:hypothetical protein